MVASVQSNISALRAFSKQMNASANNVANMYSDEYKKIRVINTEGQKDQVDVTITRIDTPGPLVEDPLSEKGELKELSNTDLAEEMVNQITIEHGYAANAKVIKNYDETLGSLIDMMG